MGPVLLRPPQSLRTRMLLYGGLIVLAATAASALLDAWMLESRGFLAENPFLKHIFTVVVLLATLLLPLWYFLESRILRRLRAIVHANEAVIAGRTDDRYVPDGMAGADEVGALIQARNRMLESLEAADERMLQAITEVSSLSSSPLLLAGSQDSDAALRRLAESVRDLARADSASLTVLPLCPGMAVRRVAADAGGTRSFEDPSQCLCWVAQAEPGTADLHGRFLLCFTLRHGPNLLGCLGVRRRSEVFTPQDRRVVEAVARSIGQVLAHLRLYYVTLEAASTDALTRLRSRRAVLERMEEELAAASRHDRPFAVVLADLDGLKAINDHHGHLAGDAALRAAADAVRRTIRAIDIPGRYGGDELLVLLPATSVGEARRIADRIAQAVGAVVPEGRAVAPLSVSVGVAGYPEDGASVEELLRAADARMYAAKRNGGMDLECDAMMSAPVSLPPGRSSGAEGE